MIAGARGPLGVGTQCAGVPNNLVIQPQRGHARLGCSDALCSSLRRQVVGARYGPRGAPRPRRVTAAHAHPTAETPDTWRGISTMAVCVVCAGGPATYRIACQATMRASRRPE